MEKITDVCSGCKTCELVCPKNAIRFETDTEGFWQPVIDAVTCVDCGICVKKCPVNCSELGQIARGNEFQQEFPKCFGGWNRNDYETSISSSGGLFSLFARETLNAQGVVFGAAFDDSFAVKHLMIDKIEDLDKLRRSKYVQSDVGDSYLQVKNELENGRRVLYSGVNCQIAGLRSFLGELGNSDKLLTIDVICHGVPSPGFFDQYIKYESVRMGKKIIDVNFRWKEKSWSSLLKIRTRTRTRTRTMFQDMYYSYFLQDFSLRKSCYDCRFVGEKRVADISLGDFWGVEVVCPREKNNWGISAIICNNTHGYNALMKLHAQIDEIHLFSTSFSEISRNNPVLIKSVQKPDYRYSFFEDLSKKGLEVLIAAFEPPVRNRDGFIQTLIKVKGKLKPKTRLISAWHHSVHNRDGFIQTLIKVKRKLKPKTRLISAWHHFWNC